MSDPPAALRLPVRAGRRTNLGLLALLLLTGATGVLGYAVGTPVPGRVVAAAHGSAGLGLLLLVPWKSVVVRRARRRGRSTAVATVLGAAVVATLVTGVLHAAGAPGPWSLGSASLAGMPLAVSALQVHVGAAVLTALLLVVHARRHPQRPRAADLSRRSLLRASGLGLAAAGLWGAGEAVLRVAGLPGGERRGTGSHERGTDDPAAMPVTQWFTDTVPERSTTGRREGAGLELVAAGRRVLVPLVDLDRGEEVRALLDCTGGWYAEQDWRGVRLATLLAELGDGSDGAPGAGRSPGASVDVVSVTGYRRRLPLRDAGDLLLATHVAGEWLSPGHGAPVRLVAPGRRGYWWVKWVSRLEVVDDPWWGQPPFPPQ